jgi:glycosyl transferase family 25
MDIPVFVINLKCSEERKHHTTKQLNGSGIPFQIIEATDGAELSEDEIRDNPDYAIYKCGWNSRYLRKGEIGCALTHLGIYRKIVSENIPLACILEDDNDYAKEFKEILNYWHTGTEEWDLLYLGHHSGYLTKEAQSKKPKRLDHLNCSVGEAVEVPHGSYGYIIRLEAAKKLLSSAYPLKVPFDLFIGNSSALGIRTYLTSPPCVFPNLHFKSTINDDREIRYLNSYWKSVWGQVRKIYLWLPFLRTFTIWIYINRNFIIRYLRKKEIIANSFARY